MALFSLPCVGKARDFCKSFLGFILLGATVCLIEPTAAYANCTNNSPAIGETVTCSAPVQNTAVTGSANITGVTVNVLADGGISTANAAISAPNTGTNWTVNNAGELTSTGAAGIFIAGSGLVITNTGQIQGSTQGISFGNTTAATGTIVTNSGSITGGTSHGIILRSGGSVTNEFGGVIQGGSNAGVSGVWILDKAGTITNSGEIKATTSVGAFLNAGGTITNNATGIISGNSGVASATDSSTAAGTIINAGSITGLGVYGASLYGGGTLTNSGSITGQLRGVEVRSLTTVTNSGTINGVTGPGILFTTHAVTNIVGADVVNEAGASITGGNGIGINAQVATNDSTVTNRGAINGSVLMGLGNDTVNLEGSSVLTGNVEGGAGNDLVALTGQSTLTGDISGGDGDDTVTLAAGSTLGGNIDGGAGTNAFQLLSGTQSSSTLTSNVTNNQTVTVNAANTTWELAEGFTVSGDATVEAGTFIVNGALPGNVDVLGGATLGGDGTVGGTMIANKGILTPGNSIGALNVNGNFVLSAGSIYEVELNAAGQSDKVVVQGTVNLSGAVLRVLAENGNYNVSTDYLIIDNDGTDAVVGTFSDVTTNFAFLTPVVLYDAGDGNDVVLTLINTATDFCAVAQTANECNVAHALDKFPSDDPLFRAVLFQTAAGAREAFNALSGEIHATLPGVLADDSRYVREAVLGRLMQATYTDANGQVAALAANGPQVAMLNSASSLDEQAMALGSEGKSLSAPPVATPGIAFWTRGYGAWGDFEGNRNAATADRDLGGFVSGLDAQISGSWRAGLAAGGAWSNISVDARRSNAEVEGFHLAGYTGGMAGPVALRGGGSWAWQNVDTSRAVVFPGFFERQDASYDGDTGQIFGEVAYPMATGGIALEPFAGLAYVNIETDGFTERGGALSSLSVRGAEFDVGYSTLGLRAATVMHMSNTTIVPKVSAAWQHAFDDVTPDAALAFATTGIGFGITGVPLAENSLLFEAGLDFNLSPTATLGVSYSGQFASEVTDNAIKGRLSWLF